ncbi:hypothetical protein ACFLWX_00880, partial [Chloroflexota bacterium]
MLTEHIFELLFVVSIRCGFYPGDIGKFYVSLLKQELMDTCRLNYYSTRQSNIPMFNHPHEVAVEVWP